MTLRKDRGNRLNNELDIKIIIIIAYMDLNSTLKKLINETIAPLLKGLGFKKSGNNFYREVGEVGQCVNLQLSRWNSAESKEFTINIGLLHKGIFNTFLNKEFPKFPKEYDGLISMRLSYLKVERDVWYELNLSQDFESIVNQINDDLLDYLIPFLTKYEQFEKWIDFTTSKNAIIIGDMPKFYILIELGKLNEAKNLLKELYKESMKPKISTSTINYADGSSVTTESEPYVNWNYVNYIKELAENHRIELE